MSSHVIYVLYLTVVISCVFMTVLMGKLPSEERKEAIVDHYGSIVFIQSADNTSTVPEPMPSVAVTKKPIIKVTSKLNVPLHQTSPPVNPGMIVPRCLYHATYEYPPFVLPPPFRTDSMKFSSIYSVSSYFRLLKDSSRSCTLDICANPMKYINQYGTWNCRKYPSLCKEKDSILVMQEQKYLDGRVDVIENGVVSMRLDCGWPADHSLSEESFDPTTVGHYSGALAVLNVPQGLSFQHFLDGVLPKLVQLVDVIKNDTSIAIAMDMFISDSMPAKLLNRIGLGSHKIVGWHLLPWKNGKLYADKLILGCKVPPLHPELWQKAQTLFDLPWMKPGWTQKKHVILYMSRGTGTRNPGRHVLNENELTTAIDKYAQSRRFEFVIFNAKNYEDLDTLFDFLANVDVVIGPHGGAFYNILFMRRDITVIEFVPDSAAFLSTQSAVHLIFYLQSMLLGDNYFNIRVRTDGSSNMNVDPQLVLDILKNYVFPLC